MHNSRKRAGTNAPETNVILEGAEEKEPDVVLWIREAGVQKQD